jgi:hypothetical protein
MCHGDISPISWHVNVPVSTGVFSRLATTHTCRDFSSIQQWAKDHSAGYFPLELEPEQINTILDNPPFDQSPWEDLEEFWWMFPGNKFFKHWRGEGSSSSDGNHKGSEEE